MPWMHTNLYLTCIIVRLCMYAPLPRQEARDPRRGTGASPPCQPSALHWPRATPIVCNQADFPAPVETHARAHIRSTLRPVHAPSSSLEPPLLPFPAKLHLARSALPQLPPHLLNACAPHTAHAPIHAWCATCMSRAPASLVASISSAAAALWLFSHARYRAVLPSCVCVCKCVTSCMHS